MSTAQKAAPSFYPRIIRSYPDVPLGGLNDVQLVDPTVGEVLVYNGADWADGADTGTETMSNVGGGKEIYKEKVGSDFRLRTLTSGPFIKYTQNADDIYCDVLVGNLNGQLCPLGADLQPSEVMTTTIGAFPQSEPRNNAFNLSFGVTSADVPEIASALGSSANVQTDGAGKLVTATIQSAHNQAYGSTPGTVVEIGSALGASEIVETNGSSQLVTASKNTAYNKSFGTTSADVPEIATALGALQTVESDAAGKLVTAVKQTGYNLALGTTAGTVSEGNHNHASNFGHATIYCDAASVAQITNATPGTYDIVTGMTDNGETSLLTSDAANDRIIIPAGNPGTYMINFSCSFTGAATSDIYTIAIFEDGVRCVGPGTARVKVPTSDQECCSSAGCIDVFDSNQHIVDLRVACTGSSKIFVPAMCSLVVHRVA